MIQSIEKNFNLIFEILCDMNKSHLMAEINKNHLQKLLEFLKPFYDLTSKFSSQSTETIASVWPTVISLSEFLNSQIMGLDLEAEDDAPLFEDLETLKLNMIDGLTSLIGRRHKRLVITEVHQVAAVLDPRLRALPFASPTERHIIYDRIIEILRESSTNEQLSCQAQTLNGPSGAASSSVPDQFGADRFYNFGSSFPDASAAMDVKCEFENYLKTASLNGFTEEEKRSVDLPLIFWREKGNQWPNLRKLARKFLAVPATSVPSEQIFSLAGRILTDRRSMLSGKMLEMSVVCKKNMKDW
jgi:hypothetical protein